MQRSFPVGFLIKAGGLIVLAWVDSLHEMYPELCGKSKTSVYSHPKKKKGMGGDILLLLLISLVGFLLKNSLLLVKVNNSLW